MAGVTSKSRAGSAVMEPSAPVNVPPGFDVKVVGVDGADLAQPVPLSDAQMEALVSSVAVSIAPTLEPPGVAEAVRGAAASTWVQSVLVNALWSINQNRNSWAAFAGQGWKKFADNSDSAIMAFTTLAAHARVAQGVTSYRAESDNKVHELYVW